MGRVEPGGMEQIFRSLVENYIHGIIIYQDGRIVYANPAAAEITGYTLKELLEFSIEQGLGLAPPEDRAYITEKLSEAFTGKLSQLRAEIRCVRKDGAVRWLDFYSVVTEYKGGLAVQTAFCDITSRKIAEEAQRKNEEKYRDLSERLQVSEQWFRQLIEGLEQGVLVEDPDGVMTFANSKALTALGYANGELVGKHWRALVPDEWLPTVEAEIGKRPKGIASQYEIELLAKDGRHIPAIVAASPLVTSKGYGGVVSVFADISERKRMEKRILEEKREAEFYTDLVTHDLNNINQTLMISLELLRHDLAENHPHLPLVVDAMDQTKRSAALITKVQKLFRIRASDIALESVDLHDMLEKARSATLAQSPPSTEILIHLPKEAIQVLADGLLEELLVNLFSNAVKFNPSKRVKVRVVVNRQRVNKGDYCRIRITDYGVGIPDEQKPLLFQRFKRPRTPVRGAGLGLSIVKTLVDRYHGNIEVADRVPHDHSKGTVFSVWLPVASS